MNRRTFLSTAAAAGAVASSWQRLSAASHRAAPTVGLIGCGWWGVFDLEMLVKHFPANVISLCDVNSAALQSALATVAKHQDAVPRTFADYRDMLAAARHDIVIIGTPDHWHALPAIAAMRAGSDVFLEKPVGVDVREGEALVAAARNHGRVVQVDLERRSMPMHTRVRERFLDSGRLGAIGAVETFCHLHMRPAETVPDIDPPDHLDYEFWTGPAPMLPFNEMKESRRWRSFMEYGNGIIGDMGVHMFDMVRWLLGLGWPESISSTGGTHVLTGGTSNIADTQLAVFSYPGLNVTWEHRAWGVSPIPWRHWSDQWGARFLGRNGTLTVTTLGYEFIPAEGGERESFHVLSKNGAPEDIDFDAEQSAWDEAVTAHWANFLAARETRTRPIADVEEGHISSACCILANLAQDLGRTLRYDPVSRTVPGDTEATERLARSYRAPWIHPSSEVG